MGHPLGREPGMVAESTALPFTSLERARSAAPRIPSIKWSTSLSGRHIVGDMGNVKALGHNRHPIPVIVPLGIFRLPQIHTLPALTLP